MGRGGQMVNVTKETKAHMHYVMGAFRLRAEGLATSIGISPSTMSRILNGGQNTVRMRIHNVYYPRLMELVARADKGGGVPAFRNPKSNMMNPPSSPEAKEFVLGPYRETVAARVTATDPLTSLGRQRQVEGSRRYWAMYRRLKEEKMALSLKAPVPATIPQIDVAPVAKKLGFFSRLLRLLVP